MKASGELLFGIPSKDGSVIHYDYTVILPVIRHTVNALQATMEALGETTSAAAHMYYRVAVLAEVIQSSEASVPMKSLLNCCWTD